MTCDHAPDQGMCRTCCPEMFPSEERIAAYNEWFRRYRAHHGKGWRKVERERAKDMRWLPALDGDPRALALYQRHYSCTNLAPLNRQFMPPGEKMVLLTVKCDALFGWLKNRVERYDKQQGVVCTVFRNESEHLSSDLILEAEEIAWAKWPGERLFTYVAADKVKSVNPGYCFKKAGWRKCGMSKGGLVLLEKFS